MYNLTIAMRGQTLRSQPLPSASQALRSWQSEEETGYDVTCCDLAGAAVSKAALRDEIRLSRQATAAAAV